MSRRRRRQAATSPDPLSEIPLEKLEAALRMETPRPPRAPRVRSGRAGRLGTGQLGTLRLRGDTWHLQYRGEPDENGRRRQHSVRIGERADMTLDQAREAASILLERVGPRRVTPGSTCSWDAWCSRFSEVYLPNLRPSSQRTLASIIARHVRPAFANLQIHEIRTARIQSWIARMRAAGAAAASVRTRFRALRWMMRRARAEGLAVEVPTALEIDLPRSHAPGTNVHDSRAFTDEELRRILDVAEEPWATLYRLCAFCGLRIGEGLGLRWRDIDLEWGTLSIVQQARARVATAPKTSASVAKRSIPPRLLEHLRAVRPADPREDALVFASPRGGAYDDSGVRRHHLTPLLIRLGIRRLTVRGRSFHAFRHWFGSAGNRAGVPVPTLQRAMRHGDVRSTQRYVTVSTEEIDQAIELIEKSFYPDGGSDAAAPGAKRNGFEGADWP